MDFEAQEQGVSTVDVGGWSSLVGLQKARSYIGREFVFKPGSQPLDGSDTYPNWVDYSYPVPGHIIML